MNLSRHATDERTDKIRPVESLTRREREVCRLVATGHTNRDIARCLGISAKTVETHRKNVMAKLSLRRRPELVRFAIDHGLLEGLPGGGLFRHCPVCRAEWDFRGEFLSDPSVSFVGYQPVNGGQPAGVMLFRHRDCGSNLPCPLEWFQELTGQPILGEPCAATGTKGELCLARTPALDCPLKCVCSFVWQISRIIEIWPKTKAAD